MVKLFSQLCLIGSFVLFSVESYSADNSKSLKIMAGGASTAKFFKDRKAEVEKAAGISVEIWNASNDIALKSVDSGNADAATMSGDPTQFFEKAKQAGVIKEGADQFEWVKFSEIKIFIGVHPDLAVKSLSKEQVTDILSGKIKNWETISGSHETVSVVLPNYNTLLRKIPEFYLHMEKLPDSITVKDHDGLLRRMAKEKGVLGFFSTKDTKAEVKPVYFDTGISDAIYLFSKKPVKPEMQQVLDFLKANFK